MELLGPDPEIEKKEIISDITDLYTKIISLDYKNVGRESVVYEKAYEKILYRVRDYFDKGLFGPEVPNFILELIEEIQPTDWIPAHATIMTRIEMGLEKIMKKFKIRIPEKEQTKSGGNAASYPQVQNILYANQLTRSEINISNELRIEIDNATDQFIEELHKSQPNPTKLKSFWEVIKKGADYGATKIIEALLKKLFRI